MDAGKDGRSRSGSKYRREIVIAGAGPAGSSLAVRLARLGFPVTLVEREKFPRQKLCGEFISPECLRHFRELGVLDKILSCGGAKIEETRFYQPNGRSVAVPSEWFGGNALSLSRAEMDARMLDQARESGVRIFEKASAIGFESTRTTAIGLKVRSMEGDLFVVQGDLFIDATGRSRVLGRVIEKQNGFLPNVSRRQSPRFVGFKVHVKDARVEKNCCEIYGFPGGYGGLSPIESGFANHCFLVRADVVRKYSGNADSIVKEVVFRNRRAVQTLRTATLSDEWIAVSIDRFGAGDLRPSANVFTVGDSAAFIDPFTGSGMLMALESSKLLSDLIEDLNLDLEKLGDAYVDAHRRIFRRRLKLASILRRAALIPGAAASVIRLLSASSGLRKIVAAATRGAPTPTEEN